MFLERASPSGYLALCVPGAVLALTNVVAPYEAGEMRTLSPCPQADHYVQVRPTASVGASAAAGACC